MLEVGTQAPDFTLPDQNGNRHSLSDYRGKKVILYFYPKDNTPGCTKQVCGFAERYPQFIEKGAVVRTTYLIDEEGKIAKAFDKVKAADNPEQMLGELS